MYRILFAHPDQKFVSIYVRHLQPFFRVDSAHDGLSALRKIRTIVPSLIVSEYSLPMISGLSLLQFVRTSPKHATIPFLFLSSHLNNQKALSLGANDWIEMESSHPDFLLDRINHHLRINRHVQIR